MQIQMQVTGLTIDPVNNAPIVILRENDGERVLPIWIGVIEASAIAFELEEVKLSRPMTHDLLKATIESLEGRVTRVSITALKENTYYAAVVLDRGGRSIEVDCRPSDAIALALRADAPIFCEQSVLERAYLQEDGQVVHQEGDEEVLLDDAGVDVNGAAESPQDQVDSSCNGPIPIIDRGSQSWQELLEGLDPEAFGKYKM